MTRTFFLCSEALKPPMGSSGPWSGILPTLCCLFWVMRRYLVHNRTLSARLSPCVWASWKISAEPFFVLSTLSFWTVHQHSENAAHFPWRGWVTRLASAAPGVSGWTALSWGPLRWYLHAWVPGLDQHCSKCLSTNYWLLVHDEVRSLHYNTYQCIVYSIRKFLLQKILIIVSHDCTSSLRASNETVHELTVVCIVE